MVKEIRLTQEYVAFVDDADYDAVRQMNWCVAERKRLHGILRYATTQSAGREEVFLHRLLMGAKQLEYVDHIDGDGLNCVRSNMRLCRNGQNLANKPKRGGMSKYKGVCLTRHGKFHVTFHDNGTKYLGTFESEEDAARAWDAAAFKKYGEFARLNFPNDCSKSIPVERVREAARCLKS